MNAEVTLATKVAKVLFDRAVRPYRRPDEHVQLIVDGARMMRTEESADTWVLGACRTRGTGLDAFYRQADVRIDPRALKYARMSGEGAMVDLMAERLQVLVERLYCVPQPPPKGWRLFGRLPTVRLAGSRR